MAGSLLFGHMAEGQIVFFFLCWMAGQECVSRWLGHCCWVKWLTVRLCFFDAGWLVSIVGCLTGGRLDGESVFDWIDRLFIIVLTANSCIESSH